MKSLAQRQAHPALPASRSLFPVHFCEPPTGVPSSRLHHIRYVAIVIVIDGTGLLRAAISTTIPRLGGCRVEAGCFEQHWSLHVPGGLDLGDGWLPSSETGGCRLFQVVGCWTGISETGGCRLRRRVVAVSAQWLGVGQVSWRRVVAVFGDGWLPSHTSSHALRVCWGRRRVVVVSHPQSHFESGQKNEGPDPRTDQGKVFW